MLSILTRKKWNAATVSGRGFLLICLLLMSNFEVMASDKSALILPGLHEPGVALDGSALTAQDVVEWELSNNGVVFGSFVERVNNERANTIGYMYNQKLEVNDGWLEHELRQHAQDNGYQYEDNFLHFAQDTILAEVEPSHGEWTMLNRRPQIVGYTASDDHAGFWLYQQPPWNADVFAHSSNGGALFVFSSERFDRLHFELSRVAIGGVLTVEYPSAIDEYGQVAQWSSVKVKDKTNGLSRNHRVNWKIPSDWVRATTHDGSGLTYGGGQYFGSEYLRDGGQLYVVRITWQRTKESDVRPLLANVQLKNSFPVVKAPSGAPEVTAEGLPIQRWRKIRGFDEAADLDQDGYLTGKEYRNRLNKDATARFRWESRVIPFGRMWSQRSSWALTDLTNPNYVQAISDYYEHNWSEQGLNGAYNDDTNKLLGPNQFTIFSGGTITELGWVAGSQAGDELYKRQFSAFLHNLAQRQPDALIGLNIGTANLYGRNGQGELADAGTLYLREHYIFPSTGLSGYAGINKFWDNSALASTGQNVIFQATTRYGRVGYFGNTQAHWEADQYASLAVFYLNYHPGISYFHQWNAGFVYGSGNTSIDNFYQAGVPKNIAYQPTHLLEIDLGAPANTLPQDKEPMSLMLSTQTPLSDYSIVGDSTSLTVVHPELPNGLLEVKPTFTYFAYQSGQVIPGAPADMVLAREFEHGRVLYRTDFSGKSQSFYAVTPITIQLEQPMRPVLANGEVGEYVTEITVGGYQGMFLLY